MAVFSFDEFADTLNNTGKGKNSTEIILDELDKICPSSYMPFVFIYAKACNCLHFVRIKNIQSNISPLALKKSDLINSILSEMKKIAVSVAKEGEIVNDEFVTKHIEELLPKIKLGISLYPLLESTDENDVFAWDFHGYDDINDEENPQGSGYYDGDSYRRIQNAISILKKHDPFFTSSFDKCSYFNLISLLTFCKNSCPEYDPYLDDIDEAISYYRKTEQWHDFYDKLIMGFYSKHNPSYQSIPEGITRIVNGLLHDDKGSEYDTQYDPFNNMGVFALNVNAQMSSPREQKAPHSFICDKTDDETTCAITVRMLFRDCYVEFEEKPSDKRQPNFIAMPPLTGKQVIEREEGSPINFSIRKGMDYAQKGRKMVCIVPSTTLFSEKYKEVRELLINSRYLIRIVLIPENAFPTIDEALCVIFVDGSKECDSIKMVDASEYIYSNGNVAYWSIANLCFHDECPVNDEEREWGERNQFEFGPEIWNEECHATDGRAKEAYGDREDFLTEESFENDVQFIPRAIAIGNGYSLNPSLYFDRQILAQEGFRMVRLSEILTPVSSRHVGKVTGPFISVKELQQDYVSQELKINSLPTRTIDEDCLVIQPGLALYGSRVGNLHPTLSNFVQEVYADSRTIMAYYLSSETVNAGYLVNEMKKDYFNTLLHYTRMRHRRVETELCKLKIQVPNPTDKLSSLEIQRRIVEKEIVERMDILGERLRKLNDQRFNEYIMSLRQRKHRIAQILNQVCPAFNLLNRTREKNDGILRDTDIVATRTGENVAQYFGKVQLGLDKIERLVDTLVDKNQWGKREVFSLEDFVSQFASKHICKNYQIALQLNNIVGIDSVKDETDMLTRRMVNMPKDELSTVFENIIANAETWGFNDSNRTDYAVRISLGESKDRDYVLVFIANNGTPIHPSVDREHIFDWGVGTHTGVGTWQAKNIVEHYGGNIRINEYPDAKDGFQTEYEISLPREY